MAANLKDIIAEDFQLTADQFLIRNRNLLDTLSKYQAANSRLNRAVIKSSTQCGCITLSGKKGEKEERDNCVSGSLCKNCRAMVENEMGEALFYMAALANALDLSLYDVILKEKKKLSLLGSYNLK